MAKKNDGAAAKPMAALLLMMFLIPNTAATVMPSRANEPIVLALQACPPNHLLKISKPVELQVQTRTAHPQGEWGKGVNKAIPLNGAKQTSGGRYYLLGKE
ncbi:MAG: hypothetical protein ACLUQW_06960 [Collinsella sp.]